MRKHRGSTEETLRLFLIEQDWSGTKAGWLVGTRALSRLKCLKPRTYQLTLAALDTLAKLYDDPLSRFRFTCLSSAFVYTVFTL